MAEQICRQLYDRLDEVVVHEVLADLLFRSPAVEDAGELDDGCFTIGRKPFVAMIHDRIFHGKKESWKIAQRHKTVRQKPEPKKQGTAKMLSLLGTGD